MKVKENKYVSTTTLKGRIRNDNTNFISKELKVLNP